MVKIKKFKGLCSSCNNAPDCGFLEELKKDVLQCEEFDCHTPPPEKSSGEEIDLTTDSSSLKHNDLGKYKGLCVDCGNRETCRFPKHEGGVWHCEEYL